MNPEAGTQPEPAVPRSGRVIVIQFAAVLAGVAAAVWLWPRSAPRASGPLSHDAYVWQRAWTEPVRRSIHEYSAQLHRLIVLNAEVSFPQGEPRITRVAVDYSTLRAIGRPVGLALRIGPHPGPFRKDDALARSLAELAAGLIVEARTNGVTVAEFQVDFDCAERKLDGYRRWVEVLRGQVAPVPLVITALPAWLDRPAFRRLVAAVDGFVLQVHSLARPKTPSDPFPLCEPSAARRAVERAAKFDRPFRVALPTYGYLAAFDRTDRFIGLSAEGPVASWPAGVKLREVKADAGAMAKLVNGWMADRPQVLAGVVWYRLPVESDRRNWRWPTLAKVMAGELPRAEVRVEARRVETGLVEIQLVNRGAAEHRGPDLVTVSWLRGRLIASDGLLGYETADGATGSVQLRGKADRPGLAPGERRTIGWVRFHSEAEVQVNADAE